MTAAGGASALAAFAEEVGPAGPVCPVGGRTQWDVGGLPVPEAREVAAPSGVVAHEPAEMIVRVGAGTTLADLAAAVAEGGQAVALDAEDPGRATVGGVLALGRSGVQRLGWGPVRDAVLEARVVTAEGALVTAGAPLVKNVTGYDLCRLVVGSLGTLAILGQVVLRCRPLPEVETWWVGEAADPFALLGALHRPTALLWDGSRVWVGLAGQAADVDHQARHVLGPRFAQVDGPPSVAGRVRRSMPPAALRELPARLGGDGWLAEVGVGLVHAAPGAAAALPAPAPPAPAVVELHQRLKARFDPEGRLNPGRSVLAGGSG